MCGICGVFGRSDPPTIAAMLASLVHRGPDDGYQVGGEAFTLGTRRLAIVDVANGRQPLANERGTVWACENGELYNFADLRADLERRGHHFRTRCDTEVLPHLWEEYGTDLPRHIDGMFAIAVWDDREKVGFLARDRTGKKPLYYWAHDGQLHFASELKAILRVPGFERRLNLEAVHHYLSYKHVPHPLTIFDGVSMLPPAHFLLYRPGQVPAVSRYWSLDFAGNPDAAAMSDGEVEEQLLALLRQSVRRRLMSDVPVGFLLSGGVDSSLTAAIAAEETGARIKTFTLTYSGESTTPGKDADRTWARWVSDRYGTDHHEEVVDFGYFPRAFPDILRAFDEPFAGTVSTFFLSRLIARHVKVAVSGDGADELFGSYRSHRLAQPLALLSNGVGAPDGAQDARDPPPDDLASLYEPEAWAWRYKLLVFSDEEKASLYSADAARALASVSTREHLRRAFTELTARDPLNRILEAEFRGMFPDQVLTFVDRLSMAHSLEMRAPYLDTDVVTFVAGISGWRKMQAGETKLLLKRAAERFFPAAMVRRPKEGFVLPVTDWLRCGLAGYVRETLSPVRLARHGLFDAAAVQLLVERLLRNGADYIQMNKLLVLIGFQEWYDLYM
jgi:asparagine synthase (glutamine-hydrolysing)